MESYIYMGIFTCIAAIAIFAVVFYRRKTCEYSGNILVVINSMWCLDFSRDDSLKRCVMWEEKLRQEIPSNFAM